MTAWNPRANDLFLHALELPGVKEREAYLASACDADAALRQEVNALLDAAVRAGSFLEAPAPAFAGTLDQSLTETAGTQIGPYKLLEQIGEGGMGVVYMAEQKEPVKRRVALKIIKPGMDTRQVIARFEAERQALALMDHPNIARVLDAGATASGRPYFVMELVNGIPLTQYCDEHHLTPRERLELFVPVCQAVQHAHQKGIIHRDLKPSNILVALYDGQPVPKVIDFGVAKAAGQSLTEKTMFTGLGQIVGTLEYMSPEQAQRNQLDVDTRSDVYTLGVVLYELLAGSTPIERLRLTAAGLDEILRIIREEDPPRPSARLSESAARHVPPADSPASRPAAADTRRGRDTLPAIAARRRIAPEALPRLLRGELDWIVMKALDKDRARRYESASAFAADIEHYLNDEPVVACPPSASYRLRKFVHRNKHWVTAGAALASLFVLGTVGTSIGLVRTRQAEHAANLATAAESRQRQDAEAQRDRARTAETEAKEQAAIAEAVNEFLQHDLLRQAAPDRNPRDKQVTVEQLLGRAAERIPGRFDRQPRIEAAIRQAIGDTYRALSDYAAAQPHLERALEIHRRVFGNMHPDTLQSINNLALLYDKQGQNSKAQLLHKEALEGRQRVLGPEHDLTLESMGNLAVSYLEQRQYDLAKPLIEDSLEISSRILGKNDHRTLNAMNSLARLYHDQGELDKAEALLEESLAIKRNKFGNEDSTTIVALNNLAGVYMDRGKFGHAEELLKEAWATSGRALGDEHAETLQCMNNLGYLYWRQGRLDDAQPLFEKTLDARRDVLGPNHRDTITSMNNLASLFEQKGLWEQAIPLGEEALNTSDRALGENHPITNGCTINLARMLASFSSFLLEQGRFAEAEQPLRRSVEFREAKQPNDWSTFNSKAMLGGSLLGQQKYADAEPLLLAGYEGMRQRESRIPPPGKVRLTNAIQWLVQLYESTDRPEDAARWKARLPAEIPSPSGRP